MTNREMHKWINDVKFKANFDADKYAEEIKSKKYDSGKNRLDLIDLEVIEGIGQVCTYGAKLYGENTWQGIGIDRYYAALLRHLFAWKKGESIDGESGLKHLYHVAWNVMAMIFLDGSRK